MDKFSLIFPDDFHIHLRQGEAMGGYVADCGPWFKKILVMPNTLPPITTGAHIQDSVKRISDFWPGIVPLIAYKIVKQMPESPQALKDAGAISGKLYPEGVTTHSEDGIRNIEELFPQFSEMEKCGLVLNIHAEHPDSFCLEREYDYLSIVDGIIRHFPLLKVVIEHISDRRSVDFVKNAGPNVAATITVHHLLLTLDDVVGNMLQPHHFCKPIAKGHEDRRAIRDVAFSGHPRFFLGTDSAPHLKEKKECASGCAGIYTAPVAIPILVEIFESAGKLDMLENFSSRFGSLFYQLPVNTEKLNLVRKPWKVPELFHGVIPFRAGEILSWQLDV